jgi:hypothetical protein
MSQLIFEANTTKMKNKNNLKTLGALAPGSKPFAFWLGEGGKSGTRRFWILDL